MEKITLKSGKVLEFNPVTNTEEFQGKARLINSVESDSPKEGIWIALDAENNAKYQNNNLHGEYGVALLINDALNFLPNRSWGLHIPIRFNGKDRPLCDLNWVDWSIAENKTWISEVPEEFQW